MNSRSGMNRAVATNVVTSFVTNSAEYAARKHSRIVKERSIAFNVVSNVVTRVVTNEAAWEANQPTAQNDSSAIDNRNLTTKIAVNVDAAAAIKILNQQVITQIGKAAGQGSENSVIFLDFNILHSHEVEPPM